jgi:hypothetical protein
VEDGLFLWLIIFAVAVLQGIGQRKKKSGQKPGQQPGLGGRPAPGTSRGRAAETHDKPVSTRAPGATSASSTSQDLGEAGGSSEGIIPADVWEEILGLARGKTPAGKPEPAYEPDPASLPEPVYEPDPAPAFEPEPAVEVESVPEADVRSRRRREEDRDRRRQGVVKQPIAAREVGSGRGVAAASPAPSVRKSVEGGGVREDLFGGGSLEELRKAIVLKEVLGPPLSLRGD